MRRRSAEYGEGDHGAFAKRAVFFRHAQRDARRDLGHVRGAAGPRFEPPSGDLSFRERPSGFTLLEILISLAIIGGLLVTLISTLSYHLSIAGRQETITLATLLAKDKLAEIARDRREEKGYFDAPYDGYAFETFVRDSPYPGISEIGVVVRSGENEVAVHEFVLGTGRQ